MHSMGDGQTPYLAYEDAPQELHGGPKQPLLPPKARQMGFCESCWLAICCCCGHASGEREIALNSARPTGRRRYANNLVVNTKYTVLFFVPHVLYLQFRYFFNLYFLLVALSQIFPPLQIGLLFTYIA